MPRNSITECAYIAKPVEDFSIFAGFSCLLPGDTDRDLDDFIQKDAKRHYEDKIAVTYGLFLQDALTTPLGFATLQNDAIQVQNESEITPDACSELFPIKDYPYKFFPAVKIGRFGVHLEYQKKKLGTTFITMIQKLMCRDNRTGCRYITVDARRDKANNIDVRPFYKSNGFEKLPLRESNSKYHPMYFDLARLGSIV